MQTRDGTVHSLDRIVVGIDFTAESLAAAQWAGRHFGRDATLMLAHVIDDPLLPNVLGSRATPRAGPNGPFRARMQSLRGALRGLAGVVGGSSTSIEVRVGDPAVQLAAYADIVDADLVVIGGNFLFHAAPRLETATTDRLLRHLARPGLIVRNAMAPPATVLAVSSGDSEASVPIVAKAAAAQWGARLAVFRAPGRLFAGPSASGSASLRAPGSAAESDEAAARYEDALRILETAQALRADVIVIGSRSSAPGSDDVARMLARTAKCSVLVVPHAAGPHSRRGLHHGAPKYTQRALAGGSRFDDTGPPRPAATLRQTDDAA